MIVYNRLWKTMKEKGLTQYRLIKDYGICPSQFHRLRRNKNISTYTANIFCKILECRMEDIMEYVPDEEVGEKEEAVEAVETEKEEAAKAE